MRHSLRQSFTNIMLPPHLGAKGGAAVSLLAPLVSHLQPSLSVYRLTALHSTLLDLWDQGVITPLWQNIFKGFISICSKRQRWHPPHLGSKRTEL